VANTFKRVQRIGDDRSEKSFRSKNEVILYFEVKKTYLINNQIGFI
jgi:hypothetical protein